MATVHLAVLVRRVEECRETGADLHPRAWDSTLVDSPTETPADIPADISAEPPTVALHSVPSPTPGDVGDEPGDRVTELIEAGAGRRKLATELDISEHKARALIDARRNGGPP